MVIGFFSPFVCVGININIDSRPRPIDIAFRCRGLCVVHIGHRIVPCRVLAQDTKLKCLLVRCSIKNSDVLRTWGVLLGQGTGCRTVGRLRVECDCHQSGEQIHACLLHHVHATERNVDANSVIIVRVVMHQNHTVIPAIQEQCACLVMVIMTAEMHWR